jgi:hypothetical protein
VTTVTDATIQLKLLDAMAAIAGCQYLSDLHFLNWTQRLSLAHVVEQVPAEDASLAEWNDALCYLGGEVPPRTDAKQAKHDLLAILNAS